MLTAILTDSIQGVVIEKNEFGHGENQHQFWSLKFSAQRDSRLFNETNDFLN